MTKKELARKLLEEIEKLFPNASTELRNWETDFQFLVCIVLSAQTTDKQVNKVTKNLFKKYPSPSELSRANLKDVENTLGGINYYKTKSRRIIDLAKILQQEFEGKVPRELCKLMTLPGVGYKTANVFLNDRYHANQGIAVDTHVKRVARLYDLTKQSDPTKIAHDLEKLYPKRDWYKVNSYFVLYGRYILKAKNPDMEKVVLKDRLLKNDK
ncbi:MAG TPA: endonuclease III [Candidatus Dojkabacteria bacterium]|nr:endonuclease III [Candidatus Dojkabacteria bacterium]